MAVAIGDDRLVPNRPQPIDAAGARVAAIATTPVKGLALAAPMSVAVGLSGVVADRAFFLIDDDGKMLNGKALGRLVRVVAETDEAVSHLSMAFPDGAVVAGEVVLGVTAPVRFFRSDFAAPTVVGPWAAALSDYCGRPLRLCRALPSRPGVDRGLRGAVSLMSQESLDALTSAADGIDPVDGRRFRMTFTIIGAGAHGEDSWVGADVAIGDAVARVNGLVGRCAVTTRHPETGEVDLPTLHILKGYRADVPSDEGLPFGVYAQVVAPGTVRIGDACRVLT